MQMGIALERNINTKEKNLLTAEIQTFTHNFAFEKVSHWHSDKFTLITTDIPENKIEEFIHNISTFEFCHGIFESYDEENPLNITRRIDRYGKPNTFFGNRVNIDDEIENDTLSF